MSITRKTGLSDAVQVQDDEGTDLFSSVDVNIQSASHDITLPSDLLGDVGSAAGYVSRADQPVEVTGDLSIRAITLEVMELIGDKSEDGDEYTVSSQDQLPEWEFVQQITGSETLHLGGFDDSGSDPESQEGFKFDEATLTIEQDSPVTIDFSGLGTFAEIKDETISTNNSTLDPSNWLDAFVEIDGEVVGSVQSVEATISRNASAERGIEQRDANFKMLPSEVIEGMRDVSFNMTVEITDLTAWEQVYDDDSLPLTPSDDREEVQINIVLGSRDDGDNSDYSVGGELQLKNAVVTNANGDLSDDADVRTVDIEGNARDWEVKGEVN